MSKIPESVYEEISSLEEDLKKYEEWKQEDEEKIRVLKEIWNIN